MPRAKRFSLAQKLATVALGATTLAIAYAGQLPALAYGPPPPPPVAPGGYQAVVTSTTVGPAGASIAVNIGACRATLTVPPGVVTTPRTGDPSKLFSRAMSSCWWSARMTRAARRHSRRERQPNWPSGSSVLRCSGDMSEPFHG